MVVVIQTPLIDHPASFFDAEENLSVQQFISKLAVERLDVAVFPGTA
jgi:hypothetical protein